MTLEDMLGFFKVHPEPTLEDMLEFFGIDPASLPPATDEEVERVMKVIFPDYRPSRECPAPCQCPTDPVDLADGSS